MDYVAVHMCTEAAALTCCSGQMKGRTSERRHVQILGRDLVKMCVSPEPVRLM